MFFFQRKQIKYHVWGDFIENFFCGTWYVLKQVSFGRIKNYSTQKFMKNRKLLGMLT
jgi:hypothetical protein